MPEDDFEELFEDSYFVAEDHTGAVTELMPGGALRPLTWGNREEYAEAMRQHLMARAAVQEDAVREGLVSVMPQTVLDFFVWQVPRSCPSEGGGGHGRKGVAGECGMSVGGRLFRYLTPTPTPHFRAST